jgi:hypothetical protein
MANITGPHFKIFQVDPEKGLVEAHSVLAPSIACSGQYKDVEQALDTLMTSREFGPGQYIILPEYRVFKTQEDMERGLI